MSVPPPVSAEVAEAPRHGFWRRRVVDPLLALLLQGTSPAEITRTLAVGTVCSLFPIWGATSVLNLLVGLAMRLNQPILQTFNQLLSPIHVVMIFVYLRLGEWIWRAAEERFTIEEVLKSFREASWGEFFGRFGKAGIHAISAWAITAPVLYLLVLLVARPLIFALARRLKAGRMRP